MLIPANGLRHAAPTQWPPPLRTGMADVEPTGWPGEL